MILRCLLPRAARRPNRLLTAGAMLAILALLGLGAGHIGSGVASADQIASVSCNGDAVGLSDCTLTLNVDIAAGGSFTGTLANPDAFVIACNSLTGTATCSNSDTTVTFSCTSDCTVGSTYRDVVQLLSGSAEGQTFSTTGALTASSETATFVSGCVDATGNPIACGAAPASTAAAPSDITAGSDQGSLSGACDDPGSSSC